MSELNDRDFDQFGSTLDNENQHLAISDDILRDSDITDVNSQTYVLLGDIEKDVVPMNEITVLLSTFKDSLPLTNPDKLVLKNNYTLLCAIVIKYELVPKVISNRFLVTQRLCLMTPWFLFRGLQKPSLDFGLTVLHIGTTLGPSHF